MQLQVILRASDLKHLLEYITKENAKLCIILYSGYRSLTRIMFQVKHKKTIDYKGLGTVLYTNWPKMMGEKIVNFLI